MSSFLSLPTSNLQIPCFLLGPKIYFDIIHMERSITESNGARNMKQGDERNKNKEEGEDRDKREEKS